MKPTSITCAALALALSLGCATTQPKLDAEAKVSKVDAEKTALARVPNGAIQHGELEKEHGKLVWSFDIASPGSTDVTEVQVDAVTGEVVSVEKETPAQQNAETKADHAK
jgi:uncharacterized membrane protein YkoI